MHCLYFLHRSTSNAAKIRHLLAAFILIASIEVRGDEFFNVICIGETSSIGVEGCSEYNTYGWTGGLVNMPNIAQPTVSPLVTTTYFQTILSSQSTIEFHVFHVIVIQNVQLEVEDNLFECMEKRELTFTATATVAIPSSFEGDGKFIFTYLGPIINTTENKEVMTNEETAQVTFKMKEVLSGDMDYFYEAQIWVVFSLGDKSCANFANSERMVVVKKLTVGTIKDELTSKLWHIRVGQNIVYSAFASADCMNWDWSMPDGSNHWNPVAVAPIAFGKNGTMRIPEGDLMLTTSNSNLGDTYGTIKASCIDGDGCIIQANASTKVKVFYDGLAVTNPSGTLPNWFYYYKNNEGGGAYGYGCFGAPPNETSFSTPGGGEATIHICDNVFVGSWTIETNWDTNPTSLMVTIGPVDYGTAYQYFIGALEHEREHATNHVPLGTMGDTDGDNLPSSYEINVTKTDPNDAFSAWPGNTYDANDGEVYAGGPIEKNAILSANISADWAYRMVGTTPVGLNWPQ